MTKTIFLTGATDGIGKALALELAKRDVNLIVHGRNPEKLLALKEELLSFTSEDLIHIEQADLSNLEEVKELAKRIKAKYEFLDVFINNAGIWGQEVTISSQLEDPCFVVDYLAPYLLTKELIPLLKQSKEKARLLNISSAAQRFGTLKEYFAMTTLEKYPAYCKAKLAICAWTLALAKEEPELCIISVNPASRVDTQMVKEVFGNFRYTVERSNKALLSLVFDDYHLEHSGEYYDNDLGEAGEYAQPNPDALDPNTQKELENLTQELLADYL